MQAKHTAASTSRVVETDPEEDYSYFFRSSRPQDYPLVTVKFKDSDVEVKALIRTGTESNSIRASIANKLGMRIYKCEQKCEDFIFHKFSSTGFTHAKFKLTDSGKEAATMPIYVFDKLPFDMILGTRCFLWAGAILSPNGGNWKVSHSNEGKVYPFRLTIEVPDSAAYDETFANHFIKILNLLLETTEQSKPQQARGKQNNRRRAKKKTGNDNCPTNRLMGIYVD